MAADDAPAGAAAPLAGTDEVQLAAGDLVVIETPGGCGYGPGRA